MPLEIPDTFFEAAFHHNQAATLRPAVCTLGVKFSGTDTNDMALTLHGAWGALMATLTASVALNRVTVRNAIGLVGEASGSVPGGDTDPGAPYNVAYLVKKITGQPGRFAQGRMYLPGVNEMQIDSAGRLNGTKLGNLQAGLTAFQAAIETEGILPYILHNTVGGGPSGQEPTEVHSFSLQTQVATQRHRMRK